MSIRFGVSPIAWINDDMPELGGDTPLETVLTDAREIGFTGIELGGKFPREASELRALLDRHRLELVGGWYGARLLTRGAAEEIDALQPHLRLLKAMGSTVFIQAEISNAIHCAKHVKLADAPRLSQAGWRFFGERLTDVATYIRGEGLRFAYHHHLGTVVERRDDLQQFLAGTGEHVGLTLDTGHAALGGIDPVRVIRDHPGRIAHVHCKDIRADVFAALNAREGSFLQGVLDGMFTTPGDGSLDFPSVMHALREIDYSGWIVVEAEQDPAVADPRSYSESALRMLEREADAAGLRIASR